MPRGRAASSSRASRCGAPRGLHGAAADGLVVAEPAVVLGGGVREEPLAQQIEEPDEDVARLVRRRAPSACAGPLPCGPGRSSPSATPAPAIPARPRSDLERHGVERVLDLAAAVDAELLLVTPRARRSCSPRRGRSRRAPRRRGRSSRAAGRTLRRRAGSPRARGWRSRRARRRAAGRRGSRSTAASSARQCSSSSASNVRQATRMSSRRWPNASSLAGGTFSRQAAICTAAISSITTAWRAASGFSPAAVIRSKKSRKTSCSREPAVMASSHSVVSRSSSLGGSMRRTCLRK